MFSTYTGENTNKILNENWQELRPSMEAAFAAIFLQLSNEVFSRVPEADIFLE
jgi:hypothetical protein